MAHCSSRVIGDTHFVRWFYGYLLQGRKRTNKLASPTGSSAAGKGLLGPSQWMGSAHVHLMVNNDKCYTPNPPIS